MKLLSGFALTPKALASLVSAAATLGVTLLLSWALVARNALLVLVCWTASATMAERKLHWIDQAVVLGAVLLCALLWAAFHQVLRQVRRASTV